MSEMKKVNNRYCSVINNTYFRQKLLKRHACQVYVKKHPTPTSSSQKVSNKVVPDLNKKMGRLTDFAQKWHGSAYLHIPIHPLLKDYSI